MSSFRTFPRNETSVIVFPSSSQPKVFDLTVMSASDADFARAGWDNPDGSMKIATAPIAANGVPRRPKSDAVGSRSLDNAVVWVNEGGASGGGHLMKALRTLVVDDDAVIGGLLAEVLESLGHTVCAMENNVADAVAAAWRHRPDLMVVDVRLGEASGIAAVKEILRSHYAAHVFVTGDALTSLSLGPNSVFIRKPFSVSDLEQAVQKALAAAPTSDPVAKPKEASG